eukprot:m.439474 g.439474  ORF g.439474 m.439474 type:complete len:274 (+) comp56790_c0_seq5:209-1030(+)
MGVSQLTLCYACLCYVFSHLYLDADDYLPHASLSRVHVPVVATPAQAEEASAAASTQQPPADAQPSQPAAKSYPPLPSQDASSDVSLDSDDFDSDDSEDDGEEKSSKPDMRTLFVGLDGAGKTALLYKLKLGDFVNTMPTVGFNVESLESSRDPFNLVLWDIGGEAAIRPLWAHYYPDTKGLVFVVDSSNRSRLDEAREQLVTVLSHHELRDVVLLVLANKQDVAEAMSAAEVAAALGLQNITSHKFEVFGTSALSGAGLEAAITWLTTALAK